MRVNGSEIMIDNNCTLYDFLVSQKYNTNRIAVEHNGHIVSSSEYKNVMISNNDVLEIVTFVGGG